ncbi:hypothetical protein THAOC_18988, partial [Thalassiosira oceanica]
ARAGRGDAPPPSAGKSAGKPRGTDKVPGGDGPDAAASAGGRKTPKAGGTRDRVPPPRPGGEQLGGQELPRPPRGQGQGGADGAARGAGRVREEGPADGQAVEHRERRGAGEGDTVQVPEGIHTGRPRAVRVGGPALRRIVIFLLC